MLASKISNFIATPTKVANILDWKKLGGAVLSLDINSHRIGLAVAEHPSKANRIRRLDAIELKKKIDSKNRLTVDEEVVAKLEGIATQKKICAFVVGWPLQPEGTIGSPGGKVLHTLDSLVRQSARLMTKSRPFTLWDDRSVARDEAGVNLIRRKTTRPDNWGRSPKFAHVPPSYAGLTYSSTEAYHRPTTQDSTVAANLLQKFVDCHWDVTKKRPHATEKAGGGTLECLSFVDENDDRACIAPALL